MRVKVVVNAGAEIPQAPHWAKKGLAYHASLVPFVVHAVPEGEQ